MVPRRLVNLSKTRQWLCTEGDLRNLYDDSEDEDGIEVDIEDMNTPDREWHSEQVEEGEEVVLVPLRF